MSGDRYGTVDAAVGSILPYDSARPDQVAAAFGVMAGLARHLANATRTGANLPVPADLDSAVSQLEQMLRSLPQVVAQVADRLDAIAVDGRLRTDSLPGALPPLDTAVCAALALQEAAHDLIRAADHISRAHGHTSHLYWDDDPGTPD